MDDDEDDDTQYYQEKCYYCIHVISSRKDIRKKIFDISSAWDEVASNILQLIAAELLTSVISPGSAFGMKLVC